MTIYIFAQTKSVEKRIDTDRIKNTLGLVARHTETIDLVVSLYLVMNTQWNGGMTLAKTWKSAKTFHPKRGHWRVFAHYPVPRDLPPRFKLIRMILPANPAIYPFLQKDIYGWIHRYPTFYSHLAHLFAHELHHFRRHHLGLHPGEGEQSANKWAFSQVRTLGFDIESKKAETSRRQKSRKRAVRLSDVFNPLDFVEKKSIDRLLDLQQVMDHIAIRMSAKARRAYILNKTRCFDRLRSLPKGTRLQVSFDPKGKYSGQVVILHRSLRRDSPRIVIETRDGKIWRWPMAWLREIE